MDVAKKIQRQFAPVDIYAPTICATQGASHVKMPYMAWPFPRSSFDQVSARTPLHNYFSSAMYINDVGLAMNVLWFDVQLGVPLRLYR